jgi:5'-AMP-activated protein kinase, catalytic alpha subunit
MKRITMAEIKAHEWFQKDYVPAVPFDNDDEDSQLDLVLPVKEVHAYGQSKTIHVLNIGAHCTCLHPTDH